MSEKQFESAISLREQGKHKEALAAFRKLSKDATYGKAALYELALLHHAMGMHSEGDEVAGSIGFKFRLNDAIFEGGHGIRERSTGSKSAKVFDNLVPEPLLQALRTAFSPDSNFWTAHQYPTDSFFSYNISIDEPGVTTKGGKKGKKDAPNPAGSGKPIPASTFALLQQLAVHILPAARSVFADPSSTPTSVEFWAHCRRGFGAGHQMHFDLDEVRVLRGEGLPCPLASTVLFLQGAGGPTLITDIPVEAPAEANTAAAGKRGRPSNPAEPSKRARSRGQEASRAAPPDAAPPAAAQGLLCPPAPGRLLVFDGGMLHGVCPTACFDPDVPRTTLMMGFWARGVSTTPPPPRAPAPAAPLALGPNMTHIPTGAAGPWVAACSQAVPGAAPPTAASPPPTPAKALIPCGAIWTAIPPAPEARGRGGGRAALGDEDELMEVGRFLLRVDPARVRELCIAGAGAHAAEAPATAPAAAPGPRVQSITMEELRRLRGEA